MIHITEPVRKSALDVIQYNLRAAGCKTYVTRVVYFGEYRGTHEVLRKRMEDIIHDLHMDYNDMPITGLFLVYPTCYIHVLEAWEDIIYKHYELMYNTENNEYKFGKAIPLPSYHHVHQRFFTSWCHVYTTPPTLIGTLEGHTLDDIQKQVSNCLMKMYTLCDYIARAGLGEKSIDVQDALWNLGDKAARYLPESTVLEFLLNVSSPVLKTVEEYLRMYSDVSPSAFWDDNNVWPPPCDIMPRDVFDEHGRRKISYHPNSEK
ncbi:unnamed protein product [Lasius platythorax]|uniref:Uncharacterized protein n=1 Tax=Lasius platythorax TaxID=488582 RepID=A0AAV2P1Q7_9HYME